MSSYTLIWQRPALAGFASIRAADPLLAKNVRAAVTGLADDVAPADSSPLGSDLYRLRVGDARIIYSADQAGAAVHVLTVGRVRG